MGRPRAFDKDEVLTLLRDEFWSKGYEATSLDDLMRATGLGKGSLYAAFGDKHHLFLEVLEAYASWRLAGARAALQRGAPGVRAIERLRAFFRGDAAPAPTRLESERGCLLVNSTTELSSRDDAVQTLARVTFGALEADIVALLEEAVVDGDLPGDTDPAALGRLLMAVSHGMEVLGKTGMGADAIAAVGRDAALRLLGPGPAAPKRVRRRA